MKRFFSEHFHWIFLIIIAISFFIGFTNFSFSADNLISAGFGTIGLLAGAYLAIQVEARKRKEKR